jgi:alkylation response protein AidB-like acyl-CoA dehydrogenase
VIEVQEFRAQVREWLVENLTGEFAKLKGLGGPGREHEAFEERRAWNQHLAAAGLTCLGWPVEHGGRGLSVAHRVAFYEEYALADAPAKVNHFGEELLGPTLIAFGTAEQQKRFLPKILDVTELWCQGYSEPGAGSDLANVSTTAVLDGDQWVINGQKVWTTLAHRAQWCFAVVRTDPEAPAHKGLSYVIVPMNQPGVSIRPLKQMTGTAEFNEVFFDDARTDKENVIGEVNDGWKVAMATLGFERGTAFLSQQLGFQRELSELIEVAHKNGATADPTIRQQLADAYVGVQIMKYNGLRMLTKLVKTGVLGPEASIGKLYWSSWHRRLGEIAMNVIGADGLLVAGEPGRGGGFGDRRRKAGARDGDKQGEYVLDEPHRIFMVSRSETIYAGASEIQRNIIGERVLGLPREPRA